MSRKSVAKKVITLLSTLMVFFSIVTAIVFLPAKAETTVENPNEWGVDTYLAKEALTYKQVKEIQITQLPLREDFTYASGEELAKLLYYHYVFKLGFNEPIVNVILTPELDLFQLTRSADSQTSHTNAAGTLIIGIVTDSTSATLSKYETSLSDYLISVCSQFSIGTANITASDFTLSASTTPTITLIPTADATFKTFVDGIKTSIAGSVVPIPPEITLDVDESGVSTSLNPSEEGTIEIQFTNTGTVPLYGEDGSSIRLKSLAKGRSAFYSSSWATPLIGGSVTPARVGPLESGTMTLTLKAPILSGDHEEQFIFVTSNGTEIWGTALTITVTTNDTGQKVLQIQDTGIGYLNVRSSPSAFGSIIDTVAIGNIYLFDQSQNGFYHIINGDKSGWVSGRYIKVLE